jgi:hypothetical protein
MRHFILPAVFLLTLSACSTYQYLTLDSPQLQKNDKNQLTDQPLFVNWKKSALIRNGQSISLYNNNIIISANARSQSSGSFSLPEGMDFIPPASGIFKTFPRLERTGMLSTDLPDSVHDQQLIETDFAETSSFYIGEVCQTHAEPELFPLYRQQGDQLYVKVSLGTP